MLLTPPPPFTCLPLKLHVCRGSTTEQYYFGKCVGASVNDPQRLSQTNKHLKAGAKWPIARHRPDENPARSWRRHVLPQKDKFEAFCHMFICRQNYRHSLIRPFFEVSVRDAELKAHIFLGCGCLVYFTGQRAKLCARAVHHAALIYYSEVF